MLKDSNKDRVQKRGHVDLAAGFETKEGKKRACDGDAIIDVNKRPITDKVEKKEHKFTK